MNKTSLPGEMELEFDVLGVPRKLVKYVIHLSKEKNWRIKGKSLQKLPKLQSSSFGLKEF